MGKIAQWIFGHYPNLFGVSIFATLIFTLLFKERSSVVPVVLFFVLFSFSMFIVRVLLVVVFASITPDEGNRELRN
ncbi:MAG TPA: hypothetical protein VJH71_02015 [Candidatus Paceibacterota bacterium]